MNNLPLSRNKNIVVQNLGKETLIYDLNNHKVFCLNQTCAIVWQHCDGQTPIAQIAYLLQKELRTRVEESVIWFALQQLDKDNLLEKNIALPMSLAGMSRRQLINTIGKSAAVAIPLVISIAAPTPTIAASCLINNAGCTSNGQCCNNSCFGSTCCFDVGVPCTLPAECCQDSCIVGFCAACVLYDTPITTSAGFEVAAREVTIGQELFGINSINGEIVAGRVKNIRQGCSEGFYSILAESGDVVQCTSSHPIISGYKDVWGKEAERFQIGDSIMVFDRKMEKAIESKTVAVEYIKVAQPVMIFEMDTREHTYISAGIVSHNKS